MKAWMSLNFGKFATELRPLIDVRIWFLLNILKTNRPIKTKFCIHIIINKIYVHGGKSKGTTCVVDRDVTAYMVVDRVLRFPTE